MTTRWARFARGWIAAIVSLFVAACSHALGGGAIPATVGLALCLAFSGPVCVLLAGKTLSLARLSSAVALSQLLFHGLFSLLADAPLGTPGSAGPGMQHGDTIVLQFGTDASALPPMTADADLRMWVGHAIGAIVAIAALGFGERAFWGLLRLARLFIPRILDAVLPVETAVSARLSRSDRPAAVIPPCARFLDSSTPRSSHSCYRPLTFRQQLPARRQPSTPADEIFVSDAPACAGVTIQGMT